VAIVEGSTGEAAVKAIRIQRKMRVTGYFMMMLIMSNLKCELIVGAKAVVTWLVYDVCDKLSFQAALRDICLQCLWKKLWKKLSTKSDILCLRGRCVRMFGKHSNATNAAQY
jgi:hypothetical protein